MNCIFCKRDSSGARSIEHIIPESLGNSKLTLPRGAVCDSCNNYFATHIEHPVLASAEFSYLRFNQEVRNKKGRIPVVDVIFGDKVVKARRDGFLEFSFGKEDFKKIQSYLDNESHAKMMIPLSGPSESDHLTSRWLAKMGLELLTHKVIGIEDWNIEIVNHPGLDPVRKFARAPKPNEVWAFSKRRIYAENSLERIIDGEAVQMVYECDILATGTAEASEFYFVAAFFGMEYAINLGGNCMDGYHQWLQKHDQASPLYVDKFEAPRST